MIMVDYDKITNDLLNDYIFNIKYNENRDMFKSEFNLRRRNKYMKVIAKSVLPYVISSIIFYNLFSAFFINKPFYLEKNTFYEEECNRNFFDDDVLYNNEKLDYSLNYSFSQISLDSDNFYGTSFIPNVQSYENFSEDSVSYNLSKTLIENIDGKKKAGNSVINETFYSLFYLGVSFGTVYVVRRLKKEKSLAEKIRELNCYDKPFSEIDDAVFLYRISKQEENLRMLLDDDSILEDRKDDSKNKCKRMGF